MKTQVSASSSGMNLAPIEVGLGMSVGWNQAGHWAVRSNSQWVPPNESVQQTLFRDHMFPNALCSKRRERNRAALTSGAGSPPPPQRRGRCPWPPPVRRSRPRPSPRPPLSPGFRRAGPFPGRGRSTQRGSIYTFTNISTILCHSNPNKFVEVKGGNWDNSIVMPK